MNNPSDNQTTTSRNYNQHEEEKNTKGALVRPIVRKLVMTTSTLPLSYNCHSNAPFMFLHYKEVSNLDLSLSGQANSKSDHKD